MFACYMCHDPRFFDGRTVSLVIVLALVAFVMSPVSPVRNLKLRQRLLLALPPVLFLCWFFLQREMLLTDPMMRAFYRSMWGFTAWRLNSAILIAFGIAFSLGIIRSPGRRYRVYGAFCIAAFLPLLLGFSAIGPVVPTSGLGYQTDAWLHPPVNEPSYGGKSLSEWVKQINLPADESEPAIDAIRRMGPEAVQALIRAFQTGESNWRRGEQRPQAWDVKQHAADALIRLGADAAPAVPLMIESLRSSERTTREQAAEILGAAGDVSPVVISALIRALNDDDTAYHAMNALASLAGKDPGIVHKLAETSRGPQTKTAYWATVALS